MTKPTRIGHNSGKAPEPFTRIPASLVGRVLDNGKPGMYAVHLLAIKCSKGKGYALNETAARKLFGIGERTFRTGLALLKKTGVLVRHQPNRRAFAVECLAIVPANVFHVTIPDHTLTADSAVVAFGLAVAISPTARRPAEVARRIGITSTVATRKALRAAEALGLVIVYRDQSDAIRVSRPEEMHPNYTAIEGDVKNVGAINVGAINVGAHSTGKEDHSTKGERTQNPENTYIPANAEPCDLLSLSDWRKHQGILDISQHGDPLGYFSPPDGEAIAGREFAGLVTYFGGECPRHLTTAFAVEQITVLATACMSLASDQGEMLMFADAIRGIAHRTAEALKQGKVIRSLAFIALPILKASHSGNTDWANEFPSPLLGGHQAAYFDWARRMFEVLQGRGVSVNAELLTTRRIEALQDLLRNFSQDTVTEAARTATVPEGRSICGWLHLETQCRQLTAERVAIPFERNKRQPARSKKGA